MSHTSRDGLTFIANAPHLRQSDLRTTPATYSNLKFAIPSDVLLFKFVIPSDELVLEI